MFFFFKLDAQVESQAGSLANFSDDDYKAVGASIVENVWSTSDLILKIQEPSNAELDLIQPGSTLISLINPAQNQEKLEKLKEKQITTFALDQVPRVTIAQSCDVLSSQ